MADIGESRGAVEEIHHGFRPRSTKVKLVNKWHDLVYSSQSRQYEVEKTKKYIRKLDITKMYNFVTK